MLACKIVPNHKQMTCGELEGVEKAKYIHGSTSGGGEGGRAFPPSCSGVHPSGPDWFRVMLNYSIKGKTGVLILLGLIGEVVVVL